MQRQQLTLDVILLQVYPLQEGDEVGSTLSCAILGPSQNISARQRDGDAFLLWVDGQDK